MLLENNMLWIDWQSQKSACSNECGGQRFRFLMDLLPGERCQNILLTDPMASRIEDFISTLMILIKLLKFFPEEVEGEDASNKFDKGSGL